MGPTWGRQDPGGPHVGPMNLAIWVIIMLSVQYGISVLAIIESRMESVIFTTVKWNNIDRDLSKTNPCIFVYDTSIKIPKGFSFWKNYVQCLLPLTRWCGWGNISTRSIAIPCAAEVWINSRIHGSKQGVTNLTHAQTLFVTCWNVSAALKSQLSH